jgi:hypothetical protein
MTQDEIINMARECFADPDGSLVLLTPELTAFAKLVAQHAKAEEREACAKIVEESSLPDTYSQECLPEIANDIRARGEASIRGQA